MVHAGADPHCRTCQRLKLKEGEKNTTKDKICILWLEIPNKTYCALGLPLSGAVICDAGEPVRAKVLDFVPGREFLAQGVFGASQSAHFKKEVPALRPL